MAEATRRLAIERDGPIARVWLARPERRNALDTETLEELEAWFRGVQGDFGLRVVVLGGRGPSFCAGADRGAPPGHARLAARSGASDRERRHVAQLGRRTALAIQDAEVVTIARIQGHAVGGGAVLALSCDLRVAATSAVFRVPEVDLGLPLTWGATARLVHEVGAARAREIVLLGDAIDAAAAERMGLVHRVVAEDDLDAAVSELAQRMAAKPEIAVHMAKTQLRALARRAELGDVTETDGDLLLAASRVGRARESFRPPGAEGQGS